MAAISCEVCEKPMPEEAGGWFVIRETPMSWCVEPWAYHPKFRRWKWACSRNHAVEHLKQWIAKK